MQSLRKWIFKPKKTDQGKLARFYFADEELNSIASELDSFDGRKEPERCATLVAQLRAYQDILLGIIDEIMFDCVPKRLQSMRQYRAKFPDDVLQESLAGQLWFGAECLAAGSSIMNREVESASMRPMAKCLTKHLDFLRSLLREQCLRDPNNYSGKINEALIEFDRLFSDFELSYVSAMVPIKTMKEFDHQQDITVLFCETVQRALKIGLLTHESIDSFDPELMFTIPRLAIIAGLLIFPDGPLNPDRDPLNLSEMFRQFQTLLYKIRELLYTLDSIELEQLEKMLSSLSTEVQPPFTLNPPQKSNKFNIAPNAWILPQADATLSGPAALADFIEPPALPANQCGKSMLKRASSVNATDDISTVKLRSSSCPTLSKSDRLLNEESPFYNHIEFTSDGEDDNQADEDDAESKVLNDEIIAQTVARAIKSIKPKMRRKFNFKLPKDTGTCDAASSKDDAGTADDSPLDGSDGISASESRQVIYLLQSDSEEAEDSVIVGASPASPKDPPANHQISFFTDIFYDMFEPSSQSTSATNMNTPDVDKNDQIAASFSDVRGVEIIENDSKGNSPCIDLAQASNIVTLVKNPENVKTFDHNLNELEGSRNVDVRNILASDEEGTLLSNSNLLNNNSLKNQGAPRCYNKKRLNKECQYKCINRRRKSSWNSSILDEIYSSSEIPKAHIYNVDAIRCTISDQEYGPANVDKCKKNMHSRIKDAVNLKVDGMDNIVRRHGKIPDKSTIDDKLREQVASMGMISEKQVKSSRRRNIRIDNNGADKLVVGQVKNMASHQVKKESERREEERMHESKVKRPERRKCRLAIDKHSQLKISIGLPAVTSKSDKFRQDASSNIESTPSSSSGQIINSSQSEISVAIAAAGVEARREVRLKFKDSSDLIHRLFVCISGVADQLQTNFASDFRRILKTVFDICQSSAPEIAEPQNTPVDQPPSPTEINRIPELGFEESDSFNVPEVVERETQYQASDVLDASTPGHPPQWIPDDWSERCMACEATFTFVRRRHHCRNCGKIFCGYCSSNSVPLPHFSINKPVRVCNRCFMFHVMPFTCVTSSSTSTNH